MLEKNRKVGTIFSISDAPIVMLKPMITQQKCFSGKFFNSKNKTAKGVTSTNGVMARKNTGVFCGHLISE